MTCELLIVGDFMSRKDMEEGYPWSDGLGRMFRAFLHQQGINPKECQFTNVLLDTPAPRATLDQLLGKKADSLPHLKRVKGQKYLRKEVMPAVESFWARVNHIQPNLILACGDLATWATASGVNPLESARGRITVGNSAINGTKVLPTYSMNHIASTWPLRPILLADIEKASREMRFPEIRRPHRFIHIEPTLNDLEDFYNEYLVDAEHIASDIETRGHIITCVSFAPSPDRALVVPFYSETTPGKNYWATPTEEYHAWQFVKRCLTRSGKIVGQNYQYDMQYEWREMGIPNPNFGDDTMLMHHVLQPELRKGLGFLASVYTDEIAWKGMHRVSAADKSIKRNDQE